MSVLPCAYAPAWCKEHALGRAQSRAKTFPGLTTLRQYLPFRSTTSKSHQCHLLSLPLELLQEIATYLSPAERILLSLTSKALYLALGIDRAIVPREAENPELKLLLLALHKDTPDHRICLPCATLHSPSTGIIFRPPNKLHRGTFHPLAKDGTLQAYLLAPAEGVKTVILYGLNQDHIDRAISNQICISTLRCGGSLTLTNIDSTPELHNAVFRYKVTPALNRQNVILHSVYEIEFACVPHRHWSLRHTEQLLEHFDVRCCLHCSTHRMVDEILCFMYHNSDRITYYPCARLSTDRNEMGWGEGCHHHKHMCECATEYKMESITNVQGQGAVGVRVEVWQWLGEKKADNVLRQKGILRNLYDDAKYGNYN